VNNELEGLWKVVVPMSSSAGFEKPRKSNRLQAEIQTSDFSNIKFHFVHRFHGQQRDFSVRSHISSSLMKFRIGGYVGSCPVNFNFVYVCRRIEII
jgi:hypothetical protein